MGNCNSFKLITVDPMVLLTGTCNNFISYFIALDEHGVGQNCASVSSLPSFENDATGNSLPSSAIHVSESNLPLSGNDPESTLPCSGDDTLRVKEVVMHRATIRSDMIEIFKDSKILEFLLDFTALDANGQKEKGKGNGVQRDVLIQFWHEFFNVLATGSSEKTPYIRHDHQKLQWEAIAKIIVYGYTIAGYFPQQLSQMFVSTCLFGEDGLTKPVLLACFRSFIMVKIEKYLICV